MSSTDHVLLIGMMGVGKTTSGRIVADRLQRPYLDTDAQVERATGRTVPEIISTSGERAFRLEEGRALASAVASCLPAVVSVAGGAVLEPANRELLRRSGTIVWLRARGDTVMARVGDGAGRLLLQPDPRESVPRLIEARYPIYEELAVVTVDVDDRTPQQVAASVLEGIVRTVRVPVPGRSYDVLVGPGARGRLPGLIPERARRAVIVTQPAVGIDVEPGIDSVRLSIPGGEAAKSLGTVGELCRGFSRAGITRHDVVIAVGGGVVTDVAGFAASCYHRGIDVVHVSTTLLGQVDAAIGGKTGVNIPEGKNLVGAFWQPGGVICDTDTLVSLSAREWRSGHGEMAKYAFLGVEDLDRLPLAEQILRCVSLKATVVAEDEREGGGRMLLNYGHTLAHALEAAGFAADAGEGDEMATSGDAPPDRPQSFEPLRHGEAVGIGLVFAARLARLLGRIDSQRVQRHVDVVAGYGLPTAVPAEASAAELLAAMGRDKKATDGLTFVLDGPDGPRVVSGVDREIVDAALRESTGGERT